MNLEKSFIHRVVNLLKKINNLVQVWGKAIDVSPDMESTMKSGPSYQHQVGCCTKRNELKIYHPSFLKLHEYTHDASGNLDPGSILDACHINIAKLTIEFFAAQWIKSNNIQI